MPAPVCSCFDLAIIGGGVAGLWLANRAKDAGYSVVVFESGTLGGGQTLASQGMIHGGMKYTLAGALTGASEAIAEMPKHWRECLCGEGDVDLHHTRILSDHFFMWSGDDLGSKLSSFLASKITRGRVEPVHPDRRPPLLRHPLFTGSLYRLEDLVIDAPSLIANLALNMDGHCFHIDWNHSHLSKDKQGKLYLRIDSTEQSLEIHATRFVFTAGKGNADLLTQAGHSQPAMQLRPLQQVMVKHFHPFDFYGHCLGTDTTPRLTISSHRLPDGGHVWYLGGSLAEKGASMAPEDLIQLAEEELRRLIPWINLQGAEWATLPIDRAEPLQPGFARPDNAFVTHVEGTNLLVGWPTKLTLAPNLANQVLELLAKDEIYPDLKTPDYQQLHRHLAHAVVGKTPWEIAFPPKMSAEDALALRFKEPDEDDE
ncbi:MAG: glycerol-3-phosphate dehydrogenase [Cellvibrio sp. 79]|nr:MAG: glycerol-3-phosphate dehydrogenase [Cellvibrio sp. 79]